MSHTKRAFTLIELLVVIAIIAILAAILFPVFAQAKAAAKKTATLSNCKQFGTGILIYISDNDDQFPLGYSTRPTGTVRWNTFHPFPDGWFDDGGSWSAGAGLDGARQFWINACQPYIKNGQLAEVIGATNTQAVASDYALPRLRAPYFMGLTFNGLMSGYSSTAVANVSSSPLMWSGFGKLNFGGRALTSPNLKCTATGPCRFAPDAVPQAGSATDGYGDAWFWGTAGFSSPANFSPPASISGQNKSLVVGTDSSARFVNIPGPGTARSMDPNGIFTSIDNAGVPYDMKACRLTSTGVYYVAFFRPDYDFSGRSFFTNGGGGCDEP